MANLFAVTDMVAKESLRIAHEKLSFINTVDRQYDDSFKAPSGRSPQGATLRVKYPNQYTRRTGSRVFASQDQAESAGTITQAMQDGVDMTFNSQELIQAVANDGDFDELSRNYIAPGMAVLCSGIESDFLAFATKATYQTVGTAGTPPTDLVAVGAARAKLNQQAAPKDGNRYIQADSVTMGGMVNGLKGLFQDSEQIRKQYREGMIGRTAMADWYENDRMWTMTNGSDVTGTTNAAALVTDGGNTLDMSTTIATAAQTVGQVFTIAGVHDVHPETKAAYSHLKQFTSTALGATLTTVSPTIYLTGAKKNVASATGADLATTAFNSKAVVFWGAASTGYLQNLMYHKEAFQFVTAKLPILDDAQKCVQVQKDNLALRCWLASDIRTDELLLRIDILYGMAALRPAWACRISN